MTTKTTYKAVVEHFVTQEAINAVNEKMTEEKTEYDFSYTYNVIMRQTEKDIYWECFVHVILPEVAENGIGKKRKIIAVYGSADNVGIHVGRMVEV